MSDDQSARLGLPYLAAGQMQKHVTLNEALTRLDALVQTAVASRTVTVQPGSPPDGALYILPADASGPAWAGRGAGTMMRAEAGGWSVVSTPDGLVALVEDAAEVVVRSGGAWVSLGERLGVVQNLRRLGVGATADASNPFLVKANKALWTALETGSGGDGDLRMTLNKEAAGDVLSLLFQSGYGGRAELGLIGNDRLGLKVSDDGGTWRRVFEVDPANGRARFDQGAGRVETTVFTASGSYTPPDWARLLEVRCLGGGGGGGAGAVGAGGTLRSGGGGGGGGGLSVAMWRSELLSGDLTVIIGSGGEGGTGASGQPGTASTVSGNGTVLLSGGGGLGGGQGTASIGAGGMGGAGLAIGNSGGAGHGDADGEPGRSRERSDGPGGGAGGGGLDAADAAWSGGVGGDGGVAVLTNAGGPAGIGADGGDGASASQVELGSGGGGGGGGAASASAAGCTGGRGGQYGAGGGGGGAGLTAGGPGGDGAAGLVLITAWG